MDIVLKKKKTHCTAGKMILIKMKMQKISFTFLLNFILATAGLQNDFSPPGLKPVYTSSNIPFSPFTKKEVCKHTCTF